MVNFGRGAFSGWQLILEVQGEVVQDCIKGLLEPFEHSGNHKPLEFNKINKTVRLEFFNWQFDARDLRVSQNSAIKNHIKDSVNSSFSLV